MRLQIPLVGRDRRARGDVAIQLSLLLVLARASVLHAQVGNQNPSGASGIFNGQINTGCSYDPYTGNATRSITDIAVAGGVGEYPLALVRTANSRAPSTTEVLAGLADGTITTTGSWKIRQPAPPKTFNRHVTQSIFPMGELKRFVLSHGIPTIG